MKTRYLVLMLLAAPSVSAWAQATPPRTTAAHSAVIAIETAAWDAWRTKNADFFRNTLLSEARYVSGTGVESRAAIAAQVEAFQCTVPALAIDSTHVADTAPGVALLTYHYTMTVACGDAGRPTSGWGSTLFVLRDRKWRIAFHQEAATPVKR